MNADEPVLRMIAVGMLVFFFGWFAYSLHRIDKLDERVTNIEMAKDK